MNNQERFAKASEKSLDMLKPAYKMWLETKDGYVFGKGAFDILRKIQELGTLDGAAKALSMSYRHAWGIIKNIENRINKPLLKTRKGGRFGGGGSELTFTGRELIKSFIKIKNIFEHVREDELLLTGLDLKISTRNRIKGKVVSVERDESAATIKIKIDIPCTITSFLTKEAVDDLGIKDGDRVVTIVKATEIMIAK